MNKIYYFTGTGNSLQIAEDLKNSLESFEIRKIAQYSGEKIDCDKLILVFPVYNWGIPLIIKDFLNKADISENTMIYAVTNYGGLPGRALDMCEEIIKNRKLKFSAGFLIKMPGNYILAYGAKSKEEQEKIFKNEKKKVKYIADCINQNKILKIEKSHTFIDRKFTNFFYKDVKNFHEEDKNFNVNDKCIGCRLCERVCPVNNITIKDNKPVWNQKCELCLACLQSCPKEAINYKDKTQNKKRYLNRNVKLV